MTNVHYFYKRKANEEISLKIVFSINVPDYQCYATRKLGKNQSVAGNAGTVAVGENTVSEIN